jgi:hypothetical protein
MGDNLVARMAKGLGLALAQERFASTYFGNNTIIGGYLKYPKTMDDKTFEHVRQSWADRHKGPDKAHKPAILEGGAEWIPFTNNAEQAQLTDSRKFTVEEICRWFGVPPHKVQHLDRSTYNNIEQQALEFIRDACTPWARRWEQEADFKLLGHKVPARSMCIDMAPLTQGDFKTRMEGYAIGRQWGVYTVNEIRIKEGENPIGIRRGRPHRAPQHAAGGSDSQAEDRAVPHRRRHPDGERSPRASRAPGGEERGYAVESNSRRGRQRLLTKTSKRPRRRNSPAGRRKGIRRARDARPGKVGKEAAPRKRGSRRLRDTHFFGV